MKELSTKNEFRMSKSFKKFLKDLTTGRITEVISLDHDEYNNTYPVPHTRIKLSVEKDGHKMKVDLRVVDYQGMRDGECVL